MSRWSQVVLVLLCCVLWCSHAALAVDVCRPQGPGNCTFQTNVDLVSSTSDPIWCSWTSNNWENYYFTGYPLDRFVGLSWTSVTGRVTSRKSCSTQGEEFCFFFRYLFDVADEVDLNVYIQNTTFQSEDKVWSASSAGFLGYFQQAYIPISTQYDYAVVFEAIRRSAPNENNTNSVYVDDLQFFQSPCPTCFTEGPDNCTFEISVSNKQSLFSPCSWTSSGSWEKDWTTSSSWQPYLRLGGDDSYGQLSSRPACSTNGQAHCLMFDYRFTQSDTINLTVFIQDSPNAGRNVIVWSEQRVLQDDFWERAFVPVNTSYDFVVIFEATRLSNETLNQYISVYIDNITYTSIPCNSVMSTTDTPTTSTPPTTTTTPATPVTQDIYNTFPATPSTPAATAAQTIPETTSNVPLIAGLAVAVAAVVILTVSVIAILVLRRHRRQDSSTARPQAVNVFQNPAGNIEHSLEPNPDYDDIAENPQDRHRASASRTYPSGLSQANSDSAVRSSSQGKSDYDDIVEDHYDYLPSAVPEGNSSAAESANRDATAIPKGNETVCPSQNSVLFSSEIYSGLAGRHDHYDYSRFSPNAHHHEERPYANQEHPYSNEDLPYAN